MRWRVVGRILSSMFRKWPVARVIDGAIACFLAMGLVAEIWSSPEAVHRGELTLAALVVTFPLILRCRFPIIVACAVASGIVAIDRISPAFSNNAAFNDAALMLSLYSIGANTRGRQVWAGATCVLVLASIFFVTDDYSPLVLSVFAFAVLFLSGPWLIGLVMRIRRESEHRLLVHAAELELRRDEHAHTAVEAERARIARELHDVIAHAISVVVVQARGGERILASNPERAREAFVAILQTGEQAMAEMRRLLGMLRDDFGAAALAPQPSLERLGELVEQIRASGLDVKVNVTGEPRPLPPGVDISAYRIVQEALTNVIRHAGPAAANVSIAYQPGALEISVVDNGQGESAPQTKGHGLIGISERVSLVGGQLDIGPVADGGFAVRAMLPTPVVA